ncbi:MAG: flagellar FliJ family protein [Oscillospiraceae bacterium]|nr:flagellar FliJ family protein [Oscillospiraceae bacterium]
MKQFKFTLQSVLNLKENMEENEKMLLYGMKIKLNALYDELEALNVVYIRCVNERKHSSVQGITIARLREISQYMGELDRQKSAKQCEIDKKLIEIDKQTEVLKQVSTEVKTLEKLKEKQLISYKEKESKENQLMIEDFIAGRA